MRLIRVFPRKTNATPTDELAIINRSPGLFDEADEVHVSVTFTWDIPRAEQLWRQWSAVADCRVNGPALGHLGEDFEPGLYLKQGYVITSRGCPNHCWFCSVPKREGNIRELPITEGWNVLDNNLLACTEGHQDAVFRMLEKQRHRPVFTGGFEAARFHPGHAVWMLRLRPREIFFAYDTPDDYEPLVCASKLLRDAGIIRPSSHVASCYVLIGYENDTFQKAEKRLWDTVKLGFFPQAMLFERRPDPEWRRFQREWANKVIVGTKMKGAA